MSKAAEAVTRTVLAAVVQASADPTNNLAPTDVAPVTAAVAAKVVPVVLSATNNEPWYQSRVTWGAIASITLPLLGVLGVTSDVVDADTLVAIGMAAGSAVGGLLTLYGRWRARKPLPIG